jgi:simple sugar transport system permease protein
VIVAMTLSGALAGLLSLNEVMGVHHRLLLNFPGGAGYVGIAVALMGRNHPVGIVLAAILFGALAQGGSELSFDMPKLTRELVVVIQGLIILVCGAFEHALRTPIAALVRRP